MDNFHLLWHATERYTRKKVIDALEKGYTCVESASCLGATPSANYAQADRQGGAKGKATELVDLAEMSLRRESWAAEAWAVALTLKTLGKDDGYVERVQNEVTQRRRRAG